MKANQYFKIKLEDLIELFKYSTKLVTKNSKEFKDKLGREVIASPQVYDVIFTALQNKRTIQNFGEVKPTKDVINTDDLIKVPENKKEIFWYYSIQDWISKNGEALTDYSPSKETNEFVEQMK